MTHDCGIRVTPDGRWGPRRELRQRLPGVATWRTKVGGGRVVEHGSKAAADAVVDDARRRYLAGARALRIVRIYSPDGGVRLVDLEVEARDAQRALRAVERATVRKDQEVQAALDRWESAIARAVAQGEPVEAVADAAGSSAREIRAIVRRRGTRPAPGP